MSDYYSHPYVSNSTLSQLKDELSPTDIPDKVANYAFGSLFHAFLLEPGTIDHINFKLNDVGYFPEEFTKARAMRDAVLKDPHAALMNKTAQKEFEIYADSVPFGIDGVEFKLGCRIKMDLFHPGAGVIEDYKSCNVKTHKEFMEIVDRFDWDRQAYFYLHVSGADRFILRGVSKVKGHPTFPVFINRQSPMYQSGKRKAEDLLLKYYLLKHSTA